MHPTGPTNKVDQLICIHISNDTPCLWRTCIPHSHPPPHTHTHTHVMLQATTHGCTGKQTDDASECAQATIAAAAAAGNGAAAYFPPGTYSLSKPLVIGPGNYTVLGGGVQTKFGWAGKTSADPAVMVVSGAPDAHRIYLLISRRCCINAVMCLVTHVTRHVCRLSH